MFYIDYKSYSLGIKLLKNSKEVWIVSTLSTVFMLENKISEA